MSLISRLFDAVRSWRRRPGGRRTTKRSNVMMEQLDHRQLLSVNFTGNVATDFPITKNPGVVVIGDSASVIHPVIAPVLQPVVKVSGFDINGIRVSYDQQTDTLSVGLEQPLSQQTTHPGPVIAGDADNNGNDGTVSPAVTSINGFQNFQDFGTFGGSEYMGAFLDLNGNGAADVVAGYSPSDARSVKEYQVAQAIVNPNAPATTPNFGTQLPQYVGNVYKVNSTQHPNLEFDIADFSKLYLAETGKALTADSVIRIGAFGGSGEDLGIGEAYFPEQPFKLSAATVPPPVTPTCPPVSPPIIINPHENRHINTAHPDDIRAIVLGSSGFDVTKIDPTTVRLGGASPTFSFTRYANKDEWLDATFVFKGTDINLPRGYTEATLTGDLTNGQTFSSSVLVFNRNDSFYTPAQLEGAARRQAALDLRQASVGQVTPTSMTTITPATVKKAGSIGSALATSAVSADTAAATVSSTSASTTTAASATDASAPTVTITPPASSSTVASFDAPAGSKSIRGGQVTAMSKPGLNIAAAKLGVKPAASASSQGARASTVTIPTDANSTASPALNRRLRSSMNDFLNSTAANANPSPAMANSSA